MAAPANTESEEENLHSTTSFSDREASVLLQSQESTAVKKENASQSHSHENTDEDEPKKSSCHLSISEELGSCRGLDNHSEASKHGILLEDGGENKDAPLKRLYEIKASAEKGLGVFAIEDMKRGTRIMCEKHLLSTLCKDVSQIPATFASLSPSAQVLYRTLSYPKVNLRDPATVTSLHDHPEFLNAVASMATEDHVIIMAIHRVNAYGASDGSVICLEASRINHSCVPNVQHNWNSRLGALTIHAVRDIAAGEELLTAYIEPCRTADHRRQALNRYGFKCSCTACEDLTGHGKASSKRRSRVQEINRSICLYSLFPGLSPFRTNKQALHAVLEAIKLLEEEEIQTFQVLDRYKEAARFSFNVGDLKAASLWQEQACEHFAASFGKDEEGYEPIWEVLQNFITIRDARRAKWTWRWIDRR